MSLPLPPQLTATPMLPDGRARDRVPRLVVGGVGAAVAALIGGAVYLVAVRGDALLFDLSSLSRFVFCF